VTIEDAAELQLRQEHVITLEARPANIEGEGEITIRDLLRNGMHMRPGPNHRSAECPSGEALDMLQAMTTGPRRLALDRPRDNSPRDMLRRLETMVLRPATSCRCAPSRADRLRRGPDRPHARLKDGTRKIVNLTEVYGIEDDEILTQDIFVFQRPASSDGKIQGELQADRHPPTFMAAVRRRTDQLPPGEFGIPPEDPEQADPAEGAVRAQERLADTRRCHARRGRAVKPAHGLRLVDRPDRPGDQARRPRRHQGTLAAVPAQPQGHARGAGSSIDKVVWANWSLREPSDFEIFNEEWVKVFPADGPVGQSTIMPPLQPSIRVPGDDRGHRPGLNRTGAQWPPMRQPAFLPDEPTTASLRLGGRTIGYRVRRNARSRGLRITIDPRLGLVVSVPPATRRGWTRPEERIEGFLLERSAWVLRNLDKLERERATARARGGARTVASSSIEGSSTGSASVRGNGGPPFHRRTDGRRRRG
jgi:hypothetical protein